MIFILTSKRQIFKQFNISLRRLTLMSQTSRSAIKAQSVNSFEDSKKEHYDRKLLNFTAHTFHIAASQPTVNNDDDIFLCQTKKNCP